MRKSNAGNIEYYSKEEILKKREDLCQNKLNCSWEEAVKRINDGDWWDSITVISLEQYCFLLDEEDLIFQDTVRYENLQKRLKASKGINGDGI
jgi:hypothetical protein